jgi:hypothetical protein
VKLEQEFREVASLPFQTQVSYSRERQTTAALMQFPADAFNGFLRLIRVIFNDWCS